MKNDELNITEISDKQIDLANPREIVKFANTLKFVVVANNLFDEVKGKNFVNVEGWQFAGYSMGIVPVVASLEDLSGDSVTIKKYRAEVELQRLSDGKVVGRGIAICSNKEKTKASFDEYAIASMAQTRAIGKAYRSTIGWVMKLAGYEVTPSEEIIDVELSDDEKDLDQMKNEVKKYINSLSTANKAKYLKSTIGITDESLLSDFHFKQLYKKPPFVSEEK